MPLRYHNMIENNMACKISYTITIEDVEYTAAEITYKSGNKEYTLIYKSKQYFFHPSAFKFITKMFEQLDVKPKVILYGKIQEARNERN